MNGRIREMTFKKYKGCYHQREIDFLKSKVDFNGEMRDLSEFWDKLKPKHQKKILKKVRKKNNMSPSIVFYYLYLYWFVESL